MNKNILALGALVLGLSLNFTGIAYADELRQIGGAYVYTDGGQEYMMQRAEILLSNPNEVEQIIQVAGLEKETGDDLRTQSLLAIQRGDTTATAEIYYPAKTRTAANPVYSTYNGRQFKVELIYYTNMNTGWQEVAQSTNAYKVADFTDCAGQKPSIFVHHCTQKNIHLECPADGYLLPDDF